MIYAPRIELCRTIGSLGLLHRRSRDAHSFLSHGSPSLLLHHDGRVDVIDVWARSSLTVSGALCGLDG
jgi:hypothetical protein